MVFKYSLGGGGGGIDPRVGPREGTGAEMFIS